MYPFDYEPDYAKVSELYQKALAIAKDESDMLVIEERLEESVEGEMFD